MSHTFFDISIRTLRADYDAGQSPVAVVEDCLGRIEAADPDIRAMIYVCADEALNAARRAEDALRTGQRIGPLHGIPFAVKDVIDVAGWPTTPGSRLPIGIAHTDAACVARLKAAGAILIGKTNLHEMTVGGFNNP